MSNNVFKAGDLKRGYVDKSSPVYQIFSRQFNCVTRNIDKFGVDNRPEGLPAEEYRPQSVIEANFGVEHEHIPNPASEAILDELWGRNSITGTDEEIQEKLQEKTTTGLTIAQMAEICSDRGYLELTMPTDAKDIKGLIDEYVRTVNDESSWHSTPPPEEDMMKLAELSKAMGVVLRRLSEAPVRGNSFLDKLVVSVHSSMPDISGMRNDSSSIMQQVKSRESQGAYKPQGHSAMERARAASEGASSRPAPAPRQPIQTDEHRRVDVQIGSGGVDLGRTHDGKKVSAGNPWNFKHNA